MTNKSNKEQTTLAGCFVLMSTIFVIALAIAFGILFGPWISFAIVAAFAGLWMLAILIAFIQGFRNGYKKQKESNDGDRS